MADEDSVCAEVRAGGTNIRLFSENTPGGVKICVFDVDSREWIARFQAADDIEQGKKKAEVLAKAYLESTLHSELPIVAWGESKEPSWVVLSKPPKR
jgi:hypothetical protein